MAMNEVRRNTALSKQNSNPVHYSNHTTKVIYVKTLAGDSMAFDFTENLTVGSLKENIKENKLLDCDTDYQKLSVLPDTVLDNNSRTLASYGVTAETTIELFCNMKYLKPANDKFVFNSNTAKLKNGMCISPDSKYIYVPSDNWKAQIYVINTSDGSLVRTIDLSYGLNSLDSVNAVCLSPDGTSFFVTGRETTDAVNVLQKRLISNEHEYNVLDSYNRPHHESWSAMCISPNGESIFITDIDKNAILVFRTSDGTSMEPIGTPFRTGMGKGEFNYPDDICMSQTGELFISEFFNNRVQVFNARDRTFNRMFTPMINMRDTRHVKIIMDVSPDGTCLYIILIEREKHENNKIYVLDASNGSLLDTIILDTIILDIPSNYILTNYMFIYDICVSPDGNFLFILLRDSENQIRIVKFATFGSTAYSTMGGKRYKKKGIRQKRSKNRARYSKKQGTKRKQRK